MPGPHDPNHTSSAGLALRDAGEETGNPASTKEGRTVKGSRRFWLVMAALLAGLATLAIGFIFFSTWPGVLAVETIGAGVALLAIFTLLLTGGWRAATDEPLSAADARDATLDQPAEPSPVAALAAPAVAPESPPLTAPAAAALEPPAAPAAPAPDQPPESAAPAATQLAAGAGAVPAPEALAVPPAAPEPAPAPEAEPPRKSARRKTGQAAQNGHAAPAEPPRPKPKARSDAPVPRPPLTNLPQSYPRPAEGYTIDTEAEDLSQLLGDVAEQTVIAVATRGQRGVARRERMAGKIDALSQEMSIDPNFAPIVAFLESISALLRAGKPIPARQELVDPFDGLYDYVLTLIRRKTGQTHD
jgi:hypothetical protein